MMQKMKQSVVGTNKNQKITYETIEDPNTFHKFHKAMVKPPKKFSI